jgi:cytochrome P450
MGPSASEELKFGTEAPPEAGRPPEGPKTEAKVAREAHDEPEVPKPLPHLVGHPLFGHLRELRRDRVGMFLSLAKDQRDIVAMPMGIVARRLVMITSPTLANEVLVAQQADFVKSPGLAIFLRPVLGDGLLTSESAEHAERGGPFNASPKSRGAPSHERQRRLLAPAFAPKRIAAYATTMGERAERYAAKLDDGATIDLADSVMHLTFEIVGKTLFDAEVTEDAATVGEALTVAMEVAIGQLGSMVPVPPRIPTPGNLRYRRAVTQLDDVVYRIIRDRRAEGGDRGDVLSMLLAARDEDGSAMTDRQVRDEAMTLFLAGHETIANALAWTFYLLGRNPDVRTRMEVELDAFERTHRLTNEDLKKLPYTLAVLKEAMRLYPPAYVVSRSNVRDVTIGGYALKKNAIVVVNIIGIHRRQDLWPDPERFDPQRFLNDREKQLPRGAYMPFGAGPRVCIGNHFALMEGHLVLATIARRVRFELTGPDVRLEPLVTLRPRGLNVKVSVRR